MTRQPRDDAGQAAEAATAHLDAFNTILLVPLPILVVLVGSIAAGKGSMVLVGIDVELPIANVAILAVTGFALLTAARHAAVINRLYRAAGNADAVGTTIERHPGALNPFFRPQHDDRLDWIERRLSDLLHGVPKLTVGLILGFVWLFHPDLADLPATFKVTDFFIGAAVAAVMFTAGFMAATVTVAEVLVSQKRYSAILVLLIGLTIGAWVGYECAKDIGSIKVAKESTAVPLVPAKP